MADDPKRGKFIRPGRETVSDPQKNARWENVLLGKARAAFMAKFKISDAVLKRAQSLTGAAAALRQRMGPK